MAQLIVNNGGIGALVELTAASKLPARLSAVMAIGYIAGHSDQLAIAVIGSQVYIILLSSFNYVIIKYIHCRQLFIYVPYYITRTILIYLLLLYGQLDKLGNIRPNTQKQLQLQTFFQNYYRCI